MAIDVRDIFVKAEARPKGESFLLTGALVGITKILTFGLPLSGVIEIGFPE